MSKANLKQFDYQLMAKLDTEMWRSYYNHQFIKLFWQLLCLIKAQLGLNWLLTTRAAYYAGWAAADYRINRAELNSKRVRKNLVKFYKVVSDNSIEPFDYIKAGTLELKWWDIHRHSKKNNKRLENSLAETAAAMYNIKPVALSSYAHCRAEAMILPRHTSDKESFTDWDKTYQLLLKGWKSLYEAVQHEG